MRPKPKKEAPQAPPVTAECDVCAEAWFLAVLERISDRLYCPRCLRECFPVRPEGPFTFGDVLRVTYTGKLAGEYLARVISITEPNVLQVKFQYAEEPPEDSTLAMDGFGGWWDAKYGVKNVRIRMGTADEAAQYERWRINGLRQFGNGRPSSK